jgi:hypothetical protein
VFTIGIEIVLANMKLFMKAAFLEKNNKSHKNTLTIFKINEWFSTGYRVHYTDIKSIFEEYKQYIGHIVNITFCVLTNLANVKILSVFQIQYLKSVKNKITYNISCVFIKTELC